MRSWIPWRKQKGDGTLTAQGDAEVKTAANSNEERIAADHVQGKALSQCQYMIPTLLAALKADPKLKVLDVGCGSGAIAIELAQLAPEGQVTGIDISGAVLESAKVQAESRGIYNVDFVKGDACKLPFEDATFDVVCTHQAVAHFLDHVRAIKEMKRVTRKGGIICMREGDLSTARFGPGYPLLEECVKVIMEVHRMGGGTPDAGRRLKAWTLKAGVPKSSIVETHSAWTYDALEGRREYGGHWPARCTQGVFAEMARDVGVTRYDLCESRGGYMR